MDGRYSAISALAIARHIVLACAVLVGQVGWATEQQAELIVDRVPFDRITLNAANSNATIDVQLLDLEKREVPNPLPTSGTLQLRRLSDPSTKYEVSWSDIAKVELYEELVLKEAAELLAAGKVDDAFGNLSFLHKNYPQLAGLEELTGQYLQRDAKAAYEKGRYDEALAILGAMYDRNPKLPGLSRAVEGISDRIINQRLADRDFSGARAVLDALRSQFPNLPLSNIATWREKFAEAAERQLDLASAALAEEKFTAARQAIQRALKIVPGSTGAAKLLAELKRRSPHLAVGVGQRPFRPNSSVLPTWADERVGRLTNPRFASLVRVGPDGGEYACPWADIEVDDSGLRLELKFNDAARMAGISPDAVARQLVSMSSKDASRYCGIFADVFSSVEIRGGQVLVINWKYPYVKPEALLGFPLSDLRTDDESSFAYSGSRDVETPNVTTYRRSRGGTDISEELFLEEGRAIDALRNGDLDVVDQVPPWLLSQVTQEAGLAVGTYRMPTVHVLLCNYSNPLMNRREFRRALCYGIDRPRIVKETLAGKDGMPGFRALSGPIPAGMRINDVLGYAYKHDLKPLPYEPRLAAVLATTARTTLAKRAFMASGDNTRAVEKLPEAKPLVLLYPTDALSRTTCGLIAKQLGAIGIPIEPKELVEADDGEWDLKYAELCLWEPLVDVGRLLGAGGLAGRTSPAMILALRELNRSTNWSDARTRLQRIHQLAYDDLPVVPLWQTVNHFAYRDSVERMSREPVSLYQDVAGWQTIVGLAERR